jgi:hypothetical protein
MNYALLLVPVFTLLLGGVGGYYLGRYQSHILDKIRTLEEQRREPASKPTITMGEYSAPKPVSTAPDNRAVGLVETKTPERVQYETTEAIEREGRGFTQ